MSDNQKTFFAGAVGAVAGLVIGLVAAPSGPDIGEIEAVVANRVNAIETARAADMEALMSAQTALTERLDAVAAEASASTGAVSQLAEDIGARVEGLGAEIGARVAGLGDSVNSALAEANAAQSSALSSVLTRLRGAEADAPEAGDTATAEAAPAEAPAAAAPVSGSGIGETILLADGAIRAFVSRIDEAAQRVRLQINGETTDLGAGDEIDVSAGGTDCRLGVSGIGGGQVALDGTCGDALAAPEGATPGATLALADGTVRVFVSGIDAAGQTARIAINGTVTRKAGIGESIDVATEAGPCAVTVTGIDRGHVSLAAACGG